jgi:hypothetical protein
MALTTGHSYDPELIAVVHDVDILCLVTALTDSTFYVRYQVFDEKVFGQPVVNAHGFILPSQCSWHSTPKLSRAISIDRNVLPLDLAIQRFGGGSDDPPRAFVIY